VVFPREKTKTFPLEFTATPATSPKLRSAGSLKKSGTESKGISGTDCAKAAEIESRRRKIAAQYLMGRLMECLMV